MAANWDYESQLNQIKEAQKQSAIADLENTRNQALSDLEQEKLTNAANYKAQRNQANVQNQINARNFKEYLVNTGRSNSGIMPQYEMSRQNRLLKSLNDINSGENMALADINRRGTLANQTYNTGLQSANANIEATYLTNLLAQQQAAWEREMQEKQYQESVRQFNENMALQRQQLALRSSSGGSGGSSGRSSSGSTKSSSSSGLSSNGQALLNKLQGSSGSGAAKAVVDMGTQLNLMAAYNSGQITDNDLRIISSKLGI